MMFICLLGAKKKYTENVTYYWHDKEHFFAFMGKIGQIIKKGVDP